MSVLVRKCWMYPREWPLDKPSACIHYCFHAEDIGVVRFANHQTESREYKS